MGHRADAIRAALVSGEALVNPDAQPDIDDEATAWEGGILEFVARRRERNSTIRRKKIESVLAHGGSLSCEACGFEFSTAYGPRGEGYIEVHHVSPLHVTGETETSLESLALVCSNCHRMCHRGEWITPADVAALLRAASQRR
ncbi:HNH endonuclease [Agromyces kandeliae]